MRILFFLIILTATVPRSFAQYRLGVFGGIANYHGDLTDKVYQLPGAAFGIGLHYELNPRISIRGTFSLAKVGGADSLSKQPDLRLRNLSFQSNIAELSFTGEFNSFDLNYRTWSPYVFAGIAIYRHNPFTYDQNGLKVFLQPLGTEGQGLPGYPQSKPYSLTQFAIPFGGGLKFNISDNIRLALEVGMRKLFTDYLDDVSGDYADPNDLAAERGPLAVDLSYREDEVPGGDPAYPVKGTQRGSPRYKDYYYFSGIHLSFRLPEGSRGDRAARKAGYGCPVF